MAGTVHFCGREALGGAEVDVFSYACRLQAKQPPGQRYFSDCPWVSLWDANDAFYEYHAYYLLPRWYGEPGDWEAFAKKATVVDPTIYPRILCYFYMSGVGNVFKESQDASWILAKNGFTTWVDKCPDSFEAKSFYCMFCGFVNDCEQMKTLFRQIGDSVDLTVWRTVDEFREKRYWLHKWGGRMGPPRDK